MSPSDAASANAGQVGGGSTSNASDATQPHSVTAAPGGGQEDRLGQPEPTSAWPPAVDERARQSDTTSTSVYATPLYPAGAVAGGPAGAGNPAAGYAGPAAGMGSLGGYQAAPAATASPPPVNASARSAMARRARLKVAHLGPVSVLRIALTFSLCMFIVLLVAVAALWAVLDTSGVFKSIVNAATTLTSDKNTVGQWLSFGRVMLITLVLGAGNVIAFTLLSTIGALLYNLCSDFVGGVEVTLVER